MRRGSQVLAFVAAAAVAVLSATLLITGGAAGDSVVAGSGVPPSGTTSGATPSAAPSSSRGSTERQPPAEFTDCSGDFNLDALTFPDDRRSHLEIGCARIDVPLDHDRPDGRTISLQLVRVHDDRGDDDKPGLAMNPGGPGASGVELAVALSAQVPAQLLDTYDLVGFDPRGVGQSSPVRCVTDAQQDRINAASPNVLTQAGFDAAKRLAAQFADACERRYGTALDDYDTIATARDLDLIRQAIGDDKLDYLGFSYGTELGAQYAHLFPDHVGHFVLDGAVNPRTSGIESFADQLQGFEDSFDAFAAYCRRADPCRDLGDPRAAVTRIAQRADASGISSSTDSRTATSSLVYTGVLSALYSQQLWPTLGSALVSADAGDAAGLLALADRYNERIDGHYSNIASANITISCNDIRPGPTDGTIRATAVRWNRDYPLFGRWSAPSLFGCQQWQPDRDPPPLPTATGAATTVLVVGNRNDPATPYAGAQVLTSVLGRARLLTWDGEGHTSYLQGSDCVDDAVNTYLLDGTVPPVGKTCR